MKNYINPTLEIIEPSFEDILTTSLTTSDQPNIVYDGNQTPPVSLL